MMMMMTIMINNVRATHRPMYTAILLVFLASGVPEKKKQEISSQKLFFECLTLLHSEHYGVLAVLSAIGLRDSVLNPLIP